MLEELAHGVSQCLQLRSRNAELAAIVEHRDTMLTMLALMLVMTGVVLYCDYYYGMRITAAITRTENPIDPTGNNIFITNAANMLKVHTVMVVIGVGLVALLPVYSKLLRKIDTNIDVEENTEMGKIDLGGEDA